MCNNVPVQLSSRISELELLAGDSVPSPKMRSGSDLARASALAEFFEHCTRATEHILATTQEPIAKRMRAIEAERLLKQDSVNFTSCSKPDETTHSVTRDLHGIEARCIDLAAAVLLPLLDTKIRRRAEVELTKQQEWDAIQTHAKEKGLSFNERILELIDDFVAWLTLAWKYVMMVYLGHSGDHELTSIT